MATMGYNTSDVVTAVVGGNATGSPDSDGQPGIWTIISVIFYGTIFVVGCIGNGLVILVVLRYTKMKTVTNLYILNLAVADLCFLAGLPFLMTTALLKGWVFGHHLCKLFYILTSINWFTSVFQLTVMSADRYLAVCHPIRSMSYRTPMVSRVVCVCVWTASMLVMLPILLYAKTVVEEGHTSCTIEWPSGQAIPPDKSFIWYALLLGFAIPVALITVFYALVLIRLKSVGPKKKSKQKSKSHRKVTQMVLTVIAVYVVCWLPYWVFQIVLTFASDEMPYWCVPVFQIITAISYANSMLNPLLYAFLSENFRKAFIKAFKCATAVEVNGTLQPEHSMLPGRSRNSNTTAVKTRLTNANSEEEIEFAAHANMTTTSTSGNTLSTSRGMGQVVYTPAVNHNCVDLTQV